MDAPSDPTSGGEATGSGSTPLLFNDVYFGQEDKPTPAPAWSTWTPFPRLPAELRLHIWLLHLGRQHRMIDLDLGPATDDDKDNGPSPSQPYSDRNHLGRVVSSRRYTLSIRGRGSLADVACPTWLLRVNREARDAARSFYHIGLPLSAGQVLYLNSEYDVVYIRPRRPKYLYTPGLPRLDPAFGPMLVDFLHDARAYDYKDQGVGHLALGRDYRQFWFNYMPDVNLTPAVLHPAAAASFADILRRSLRSLLCVVRFRCPTRAMGQVMARRRFHFAQTLPLRRHGHPTGSFRWFQADPRPGVELDLRQLSISDNPHGLLQDWRQLKHDFGVTSSRPAAGENHHGGGCRLYICPAQRWPSQSMPGADGAVAWTPTLEDEMEERWSREELARHLQWEAEDWLEQRWFGASTFGSTHPMPKYCADSQEEANLFEAMERLPCTAIGMWLFPAEAFPQLTQTQTFTFDISTVRPGLFLFRV